MLPWWVERLGGLHFSENAEGTSLSAEPIVVLQGEASVGSMSSACRVDLSCEVSFVVDTMQKTKSGFPMQVSSLGTLKMRICDRDGDGTLRVCKEAIRDADVAERAVD